MRIRRRLDDDTFALLHLENEVRLADRGISGVIRKSKTDLTFAAEIIGAVHATADGRTEILHDIGEAAGTAHA